ASAKAVATAASTALPPCLRIANPASEPGADTLTTTPFLDSIAFSPPWLDAKNGNVKKQPASTKHQAKREVFMIRRPRGLFCSNSPLHQTPCAGERPAKK